MFEPSYLGKYEPLFYLQLIKKTQTNNRNLLTEETFWYPNHIGRK